MSLRKTLKSFLVASSDEQNLAGHAFSALKSALLFADGLREIALAKWALRGFSQTEKAALFPNFLGIGAQKSATSWLHVALQAHPQICLPTRRKELHFFDYNFWKRLDWYRWHFAPANQSTNQPINQINGEITPAYSILPKAKILEIKQLNPDLKLILLLRNPIERAWSSASMEQIRNKNRARAAVPTEALLRQFRRPDVLARGDYAQILENWRAVFPENQLFIGYYEDVAERPAELLREIFAFLGVDTAVEIPAKVLSGKVNVTSYGLPTDPILVAELKDLYLEKMRRLCAVLPSERTAAWLGWAEGL